MRWIRLDEVGEPISGSYAMQQEGSGRWVEDTDPLVTGEEPEGAA